MESKNQIFEAICEIITTEEFANGQMDFHVKNCQVFDEADENKLEYTDIFELYVKMVEDAIDSELYKKFEKADVEDFYKTFKDNYAHYKEINIDAFEILWNAIDFMTFKTTMLRFKKGVTNEQGDADKTTFGGSNLGTAGQEKFWKIYNEGTGAPWRKTLSLLNKEKLGYDLELFQKPSEETPIDTLRMHLTFKNTKMDHFLKVFTSGPPMKAAKERKKIRDISENESLIYILITPPIMDPREQLIKRTIHRLDDGKVIQMLQSVLDDEVPIKPKVVRAQMFKCQLLEQVGDDLSIVDISNMDMKGNFPSRMMNMVISKMLTKGIKEITDEMAKTA